MTVHVDDYYAREADRIARGPQLYGGNAALVQLRCFKYYHPDVGSLLTAPDGRQRWMGPKASRIYAIAHRDAGRHTTMKAIAAEAMCCVSTVSRALTRLQAFGFLAVDVKRGRNGGITVRLRRAGDAMKHYASAAWRRIRSWIKVASRSPWTEEALTSTSTEKDATFTEDALIEQLGARVRAGEITIAQAQGIARGPGARRTDADLAHDRATAWALEVLEERRRLDREEPDWDLLIEQARERWLT